MKREVSVAVAAVAVAVCLWFSVARQARSATLTKYEVRRLEVGWTPGSVALRMRFTLSNGQAIDHRTDDPLDAERLLRAADTFASGHARIYAEVENNAVHGVLIDVRAPKAGP